MPRKKKCPGCGEDQALHKPGTANKHCEGLPTPGLPPSAKKGEETTQGPNLEALQQRKLDLQRALEAKKLQAEIDELEKQLAGDAPSEFGGKKKTAEETTLVDKQNTGEESTSGAEKKTGEESTSGAGKKTGEESTSVDRKHSPPESTLEKDLSNLRLGAVSGSSPTALLGKDDVTLEQLRQNTALQRAVEAKLDALAAPTKSAKGKRSILSPEQFVFSYDSAEPKKYDDLTQDEFLSGYMGLFLSPDLPDWEHQGRLKLMRFVCHRLTRYTWATARAFHHAAIQRALRDPSRWQTDWDELKEFYFDGDSTKLKPTGSTSSADGGKARTAARPCIEFNKDECRRRPTHASGTISVLTVGRKTGLGSDTLSRRADVNQARKMTRKKTRPRPRDKLSLPEISSVPRCLPGPLPTPAPRLADFRLWHHAVRTSGLPNYLGEKIAVPTKLNIPVWRHLLGGYHDNTLCDLIEFGFPINYVSATQPKVPKTTHPSAISYADHVNKHIRTELAPGATIGPITTDFFAEPLICNPLQAVPKKDSNDRRVVVDFSFPDFMSVNAAHPLCPRRAYLHMCSVIHAPPTSPAFLVPRAGAGFVPLTHDSLVKHLKTLLEHAGLLAAQYSGHSFRRGGATSPGVAATTPNSSSS
ncbi:hypothetical protein Bbelb_317140 [Branchiostoma belcheri]|nr:hypothetical protein Bbelb_317140 [Branchiostoma belcheri]